MNKIVEKMQVTGLHKQFDQLQQLYGDPNLDSIYGAGCIENPDIMFIFMNPTGRNVGSSKDWKGIKVPWLGTKNIWKLFYQIGILDSSIYQKITELKPQEWDVPFSEALYQQIASRRVYITNLGKCTQTDAKPLPNKVFKEYLTLLEQEIDQIQPKCIVTFGNQVSSILLNQPISVSQCRRVFYLKTIHHIDYKVYPVFYPVGQGMRNIDIAINDLLEIGKTEFK